MVFLQTLKSVPAQLTHLEIHVKVIVVVHLFKRILIFLDNFFLLVSSAMVSQVVEVVVCTLESQHSNNGLQLQSQIIKFSYRIFSKFNNS